MTAAQARVSALEQRSSDLEASVNRLWELMSKSWGVDTKLAKRISDLEELVEGLEGEQDRATRSRDAIYKRLYDIYEKMDHYFAPLPPPSREVHMNGLHGFVTTERLQENNNLGGPRGFEGNEFFGGQK